MNSNVNIPADRADFIAKLKRVAKAAKRLRYPNAQLSELHDKIAKVAGYNNWSVLHRDILRMPQKRFEELEAALSQRLEQEVSLNKRAREFDRQAAIEEMETWVKANFTPLVEFAFRDSESETGYAWPDEEINYALQEEFSDRYPDDLIEEVATDLEIDYGPWGREDYGDDEPFAINEDRV